MYDDPEENSLRIKGPTAKNHYGWMHIDWNKREVTLQLLSTIDSSVILEHVEQMHL